jgi:hypothetical protein
MRWFFLNFVCHDQRIMVPFLSRVATRFLLLPFLLVCQPIPIILASFPGSVSWIAPLVASQTNNKPFLFEPEAMYLPSGLKTALEVLYNVEKSGCWNVFTALQFLISTSFKFESNPFVNTRLLLFASNWTLEMPDSWRPGKQVWDRFPQNVWICSVRTFNVQRPVARANVPETKTSVYVSRYCNRRIQPDINTVWNRRMPHWQVLSICTAWDIPNLKCTIGRSSDHDFLVLE